MRLGQFREGHGSLLGRFSASWRDGVCADVCQRHHGGEEPMRAGREVGRGECGQ